jgi:hypothetical protein
MLRLQAFPLPFVTIKHYGIYDFYFHEAGCLVQFWQILSRSCVVFLVSLSGVFFAFKKVFNMVLLTIIHGYRDFSILMRVL